MHPCGQYRKNTVVGILQAENGLAPLFRILISPNESFFFLKINVYGDKLFLS